MKTRNILKAIIAVLALLAGTTTSFATRSYAGHSILSSGNWKKISVKETGVCKLTYDQIKKMGFANPSQVRIYGYGGAQLSENFADPKIDDLCETPLYDSGSAIYFYAQGPQKWEYINTSKGSTFTLTSNLYSFYGYYFLTDNTGKREIISYDTESDTQDTALEETEIHTYMEHYAIKEETYNTIHSGKCWLGNAITSGSTKKFNFNVPEIDTDEISYLYANLAAFSQNLTSSSISIGDQSQKVSFNLSSDHIKADQQQTIITFIPDAESNIVSLKYNGKADNNTLWVEQLVLNAYRELKIHDGIMYFRNPKTSKGGSYSYHITGANENVIVWNITNPQNVTLIPTKTEQGKLIFQRTPNTMEEFVAFDPTSTDFVSAEYVGNIANQDLHSYSGYDFIIISPDDFISEARRLADIHTQHDGISVLVVTPNEIYNEFSSGTPDASAIRWFLKMFYDRGELKKNVLLFGDGCFDNRNIMLPIGAPKTNYIIAYEGGNNHEQTTSYVTDDYYCFLDDSNNGLRNGNMKMNYSIGRFPVSSLLQASNMVNKVEKYLTNPQFGDWRNRVCLVADDNNGQENPTPSTVNKFFGYSDNIANIVHQQDASMEIQKIHLDSYSRQASSNGSRYPEAEELIEKAIQDGVIIMNYIGHSSELAWSDERVFTQNQAGSIFNEKQGFWFTASCEFTRFDNYASSGGEDLVLNPNGGALTLFSAARTVYDDKNDNLNRKYAEHLFDRDENLEPLTIGEVCRLAKNEVANDSNKLSFTLLGDPALKLAYPEGNVETDSIILLGKGKTDTLKALSEAKIYGHIEDANKNEMDGFNGIVNITIYDKESMVYTKGNLYATESEKIENRHAYYDRLNILFSGKAEVKNGRFNFTLKVPKDINYNYGEGRIHYYAYDESSQYDADGYHERAIIGGSDDCEMTDETGPEIRMFMNQKSFLSGDKVNEKPVLIAEIHDENGINASGCGIGHDITLTIDGSKTPIILNKNLAYDIDSYSDGTITYQIPDLEEGYHTLTLRAWDLLNNSTQKEISFVVDKELPIQTCKLKISIAEGKDEAIATIMHDRAQEVTSFKIIIYNSEGKVILETPQTTERLSQDLTWEWNLCGNNGNRVCNGLYIIRAEFETQDGDYFGLSEKMLLNTQK